MPDHRASPASRHPLLATDAASGPVLLLSAVLALIWANSRFAAGYAELWHTSIQWAGAQGGESLRFWINDGLMSVFFLLVGLELRWELQYGALAKPAVAMLPALAAGGGVLAPALIYLLLNPQLPARSGWGVAVATDIAFAVGVLTLLGARASRECRVLLLAIAIADDLIAILIIATFYSGNLGAPGLLIAAAGVASSLLLQRLAPRSFTGQAIAGAIIWFGFYRAHIHPSIAGAVLGLLLPSASGIEEFDSALKPWVAFLVLPLFAIANAGIAIAPLRGADAAALHVTFAIAVALAIGKPLGIGLAVLGTIRLGLASLPPRVHTREVILIGITAGIGFTLAMFIANVAFDEARLLEAAKLGALLASSLAAAAALIYGRFSGRRSPGQSSS